MIRNAEPDMLHVPCQELSSIYDECCGWLKNIKKYMNAVDKGHVNACWIY